jgi:hypothetical protein
MKQVKRVRHENKIEKGNGRNLLKRSNGSWRNINVFRQEKIKETGVCTKASQQVKNNRNHWEYLGKQEKSKFLSFKKRVTKMKNRRFTIGVLLGEA